MDDVLIVKAADHMDDGVRLPDVGQNLLPRPSPLLAPFTRPAMSTNSMTAGVFLSGWYISASLSSRSSGTATMPTLGSMVQNG